MPDIIITPSSGIIDFFPVSTRVGRIEGSGNTINIVNPSGFVAVSGSGLSINTSSPNATFHAYSATSGATLLNIEGTNGSLFSVIDNLSGTLMSVNNNAGLPVFEVFSDDRVVAGRFGQNDFIMTSGGNVGIGTGVPSSKFHVVGTSTFNGDVSSTGSFIAGSGSAALPSFEFINDVDTGLFSPATNAFGISTSGVERLRIDSVGRVGIGTSNPAAPLHIFDPTTSSSLSEIARFGVSGVYAGNFRILAGSTSDRGGELRYYEGDTEYSRVNFDVNRIDLITRGAYPINFLTNNNGTEGNNQRMTITSAGNVGIGTSSPSSTLQVSGLITANSGNFTQVLQVNGTGVSISGHSHTASDISNFNSSVSGVVSGIYAPLSSPALIGTPTVPTAASGTNTTQIASTAFVRTEISNLVAAAPATLDTLNELATALGNDASFSTTVTTNLAGKANLSGATFTGNISSPSGSFSSLTVSEKPVINGGYDYEIHVSQVDGDDTTGNGDLLSPVASITKALTLVGSQRKTIIVHPGTYTENPSITVQYTTITGPGLIGGNIVISGTLSTNTGCTIAGIKMTNLTIATPTGAGNVNILNCEISGTLTKSSNADYTVLRLCDYGSASITGAGLVAIFGGNPNFTTVNNASANIIIKSAVTVAPVLTSGTLSLVDSIVAAAVTNAITSASSSVITLANCQMLTSALSNVAPVVLSGFYSILNCVYDKTNSTLVALSATGGSTNSIDYFQYINADKFITHGGTSSQYLKGDGSLALFPDNIVHTTGNQTISGVKTFSDLPFVNGTGISISGHTHTVSNITNFGSGVSGLFPSTIVYTTGNQNINGIKTFGNSISITATGTNVSKINIGGENNPQSYVTPGQCIIAYNDTDTGKISLGTSTTGSIPQAIFNNVPITLINSGIFFNDVSNNIAKMSIAGSNLNINALDSIELQSNGNAALIIDGDGTDVYVVNNLGVGTTAPSSKLQVVGDMTCDNIIPSDPGNTNFRIGTSYAYIDLLDNTYIYGDGEVALRYSSGNGGQVKIIDVDSNMSALTVINNNIGIGTDNPLAKLHVVGDVLSSGSFIAGSGTAALPSFEFAGDPDTGFFSPATNTIAVSTSGVERLRINNSGNIGIGTTVPGSKLTIGSGIGDGANVNSTTGYDLAVHHGDMIIISPEDISNNPIYTGITLFVSRPGGYQGGQSTLDFASRDRGNNFDRGVMARIVGGNTTNAAANSSLGGELSLQTAPTGSSTPTSRLFINRDGNIGIGNSSPNGRLHVLGTGLVDGRLSVSPTTAVTSPLSVLHVSGSVTNNASLMISGPTVTRSYLGIGNSDTIPFLSSLNADISASTFGWGFFDRGTDGFLNIQRKGGASSWSSVMTMDRTNGNVGIGTGVQATTPPEKLTVDGNIRLSDTATSIGNKLQFNRGGGTANDYTIGKEGNHLGISTANDGSTFRFVQFGYHSGSTWTPRTVINGYTGAVGIGTTSPTSQLHVIGSGIIASGLSVSGSLNLNGSGVGLYDTSVFNLGTISGSNAINCGQDRQIQTLTLNGVATTFTTGTGWPSSNSVSRETTLNIFASGNTSITWTIVNDWYRQPDSPLPSGRHIVLLRSVGSGTMQGHYIGNKTN
jgi:hypothetical protein